MAQIVYVEELKIKVHVDGKFVGTIRHDDRGYFYQPKGRGLLSVETFHSSVAAVKKQLEN